MTLTNEIHDLAVAATALLDAIGSMDPALARRLHDVRIAFDTRENVVVICPIEPSGASPPLFALRCDPADPESFGVLAIPIAISGCYGPAMTTH